ncbi:MULTISPECIES: hypothetical protein [Streptococcus]|jgi:hypothetical protein|uniref:DUF3278 domain-containing protein n=1 Tax=Streptococcus pseudopneumoniae TaxID=257758 RepID=A0A0T8UFS1_9STRE|nr:MULTISPECIES: hypothetical protein [Streptococcus]MDU6724690.1 hypothetical protein [Streptococcus mitis]MBF9651632.1 hypothetical protein [Streptococcus pseudopneumoniae]RJP78885.1 hypothetical protein C5O68_10665 [Streptococcus pseudopneumoniae]CJZ06626.1 Uncharacterised protein [Streptococcus pseudopneumoniae]CKB21697.1 Uncharacterised protein [Streptococcus pseudopneumoniae]
MSEYNVKHLEMIQAIIERMGNNSFVIKGWSFTSIGALFAFWFSNTSMWYILLLNFCVTILFWFHDAYYLSLERQFRRLYDEVRLSDIETDFRMTPKQEEGDFLIALFRPILKYTYGLIVIATLILLIVFR